MSLKSGKRNCKRERLETFSLRANARVKAVEKGQFAATHKRGYFQPVEGHTDSFQKDDDLTLILTKRNCNSKLYQTKIL